MLNELLPYYNQELTHIRDLAGEFAKAYPKVASRLSLGVGEVEDPQVARLIESFAFLTAHIRHKLDDDFPELAEALLGILYPHYQAPIPAFSIVQFQCQPDLTTGHLIAKHTLLETLPAYSDLCHFNTVYPVILWPIHIAKIAMHGLPLQVPPPPAYFGQVKAALRISLSCMADKMTFAELAPHSLRFYLDAQTQHVYQLHELIFNHLIGIAVASKAIGTEPVFLDKAHIQLVGFEKEEYLLPYSAHASQGYCLLTEFFVFPEKFLFFDLISLDKAVFKDRDNQVEIFLYFDHSYKELEKNIHDTSLKLGCTPIVNLFHQVAEPIQLTDTRTGYLVIPDARRPSAMEVYSIEKVTALTNEGEAIACSPFYGYKHSQSAQDNHFWNATRKTKTTRDNMNERLTDIYLSFTDLDLKLAEQTNAIIHVETLCTNGNLPHKLPCRSDEPCLQLSAASAPLASIHLIMPFTKTLRPRLRDGMRWKLISHLSLNHLSLTDEANGIEVLKEILRLYNVSDSTENKRIIDSLLNIKSRRITARSPAGFQGALCQGIEVSIQLDETQFVGSGLYLFTNILSHFLSEYTTINSFVKLIITSLQTEGTLYQWSPRLGNNPLL